MNKKIAVIVDEIYGKHVDPSIVTDSDLLDMIWRKIKSLELEITKLKFKKAVGLME